MGSSALGGTLHVFAYEGRDILYHAETGTFFEIDGLARDAVACAGVNARRDDVIAELSGRYPLDQIVGVIEELEGQEILAFSPLAHAEGPEPCDRDSSAPQPVTMCLHVSHACNVTCTYCFAHGGDYGGKARLMDWPTARRAVEWLTDISETAGACRIEFFGGEPMLNFSLVRRVVDYAGELAATRGMEVTFGITTNGTILQPEMLAFILEREIDILMSVDGDRRAQDRHRTFHDGSATYACVSHNAARLAAQRPDLLQVRATMTGDDTDIHGIARSLTGLGAGSVSVSPVCVSPHHPDAIREAHLPELRRSIRRLARQELAQMVDAGALTEGHFAGKIRRLLDGGRKEYGCGGGQTYFGVAADGGIYFCSAFASMPEFRVGHVTTGLDPAAAQRFARDLHVDARSPCNACWARYLCGGGCAYDAQVTSGDARTPNPVSCDQIRYGFERAMGMALELKEQRPDLFHSLVAEDA